MYFLNYFAFSWTVINSFTELYTSKKKLVFHLKKKKYNVVWNIVKDFGSLYYSEFFLLRSTKALLLYSNWFAVPEQLFLLVFWTLRRRINCVLLFVLVAKMFWASYDPELEQSIQDFMVFDICVCIW